MNSMVQFGFLYYQTYWTLFNVITYIIVAIYLAYVTQLGNCCIKATRMAKYCALSPTKRLTKFTECISESQRSVRQSRHMRLLVTLDMWPNTAICLQFTTVILHLYASVGFYMLTLSLHFPFLTLLSLNVLSMYYTHSCWCLMMNW